MIDKCGLNSGVAISATDEMPQELIDLDAKASNILDDTHPKYRFRLLLNFLADIQFKRVTGISSPRETIRQCLKLDEDISSIGLHVLSVEVLGAALVDGQDILVTKRCTALRTLRLVLNCWIQTCLATTVPAPPTTGSDDDELYSRAYGLMIAMGNDLLETTRQLLISRVTLRLRFMILPLYTMCEEPLMPARLKASARDLIRFMGLKARSRKLCGRPRG